MNMTYYLIVKDKTPAEKLQVDEWILTPEEQAAEQRAAFDQIMGGFSA